MRSVSSKTTTRHFRRALLLAIAAAPLALGYSTAWGQATTEPAVATTAPASTQPGVATTQGGYILNFHEASADAVLEQLSEAAGFVVIKEYRPDKRVTLLSKKPVNAEEAVALLNTVLNDQGAAAILMGRELKIVARDKARKGSIPVHVGNDPTKIAQSDELITQVIPIRYADAVQLKTDMAPLVSTDADFTANASSNTIIVTDTSANVRRVVEIISSLDMHIADAAEVKVFQLKYANATNTAKLINDIFKPSQTPGATQSGGGGGGFFRRVFGGGGGGGGGFGGGGTPGGAAPGGGSQGAHTAAQVNASSDDRTNTVVVTGPADTLEVVARVIKEIDSNPVAQQSVFIYNLKNGQAQNIAVVLNNLLNGTSQTIGSTSNSNRSSSSSIGGSRSGGGAGGTSGLGSSAPIQRTGFGANGSTATGGGSTGGFRGGGFGGFGQSGISTSAAQAADQLAGQVTVVANPDTNSLLVMTSPKNFDQVKTILNDLDRPVPQVLIKVLIAEVTHEDSTDLGAEFSWMNIHLKPNGISPSGNSETSSTVLGAPSQGYFATITEDHLSATIHALESKSKVDVLSRPYILTSDNQLATVTVGQNVPYPTNSTTDINGGTHTSITYADIGIILNVTPHINSDGLVILDVNPEVSSISNSVIQITQGLNASVFNIRSADSRVGVIDGQTIVIGGLMADNLNQTTTQVPILGDIPIIGNFFKHDIHDKTKTELLFFLTPHVAPRPEVLKAMAADEMRGTKLTPNAVGPGVFKEHMEGLQRGSTTQESATQPAAK